MSLSCFDMRQIKIEILEMQAGRSFLCFAQTISSKHRESIVVSTQTTVFTSLLNVDDISKMMS